MNIDSSIDNSFFHQDLCGLNVLVFVPHEDDEINTCGALLKTLSGCGAKIKLVYTTNGDWKYPALTRMREAKESAKVLGIKENELVFLGYGDSISNDNHNHIFYAIDKATRSAAGSMETYGTSLYSDYSYLTRGRHQEYVRSNYLEDLIAIIETEMADFIICTDFDEHPDHRMLALLFDEAIGIVCKKSPDYHPEVWKRFAYSLAYTAIPDYSTVNNAETKRPNSDSTEKYSVDIIDKLIYSWSDRIRVPVPFRKSDNIRNHFISKALRKHKSQRIITHADRIINSDEVYWKRRTDNLAFSASVSVTSGDGSYLNDFLLYNTDDIDSVKPVFRDYFWQPEKNDNKKQAVFQWSHPQHIEQMVIYSAVDSESQIQSLIIHLDDGSVFTVKDIPNDGRPCCIALGEHDNITRCVISIVSFDGNGYGISECEFFSSNVASSCINPFLKIISDENFLYEYIIKTSIKSIRLGVYLYGMDAKNCEFEIINGKSKMDNDLLLIDPSDKEIVVKCKCSDAFDQIAIRRMDSKELSLKEKEMARDASFLKKERICLKFHNMFYILSKEGVFSVIKRTVKNIILPKYFLK